MPNTIANYLKQMKMMGIIDVKLDGYIYLNDSFIDKAIKLEEQEKEEQKEKPLGRPPTDNKVDENGFFKY